MSERSRPYNGQLALSGLQCVPFGQRHSSEVSVEDDETEDAAVGDATAEADALPEPDEETDKIEVRVPWELVEDDVAVAEYVNADDDALTDPVDESDDTAEFVNADKVALIEMVDDPDTAAELVTCELDEDDEAVTEPV